MQENSDLEVDTVAEKGRDTRRWRKQMSIVMTTIGLSFCTSSTFVLKKNQCIFYLVPYRIVANTNSDDSEDKVISLLAAIPLFLSLVMLAEWKGRRLLLVTLCLLTVLSPIATLMPEIDIAMVCEAVEIASRAATLALTALIMAEYCEPKHRIAYLLLNSAVQRMTYLATLKAAENYTTFENYLLCFKILIGLVCLALVFTFPESPYWLASKRRFEEAKQAFLAVRSEGSKDELQDLTNVTPLRISPRMVYVPTLLGLPAVVLIIVMTQFDCLIYEIKHKVEDGIWLNVIVTTLFTLIIVFVAMKLPRRTLVILGSLLCVGGLVPLLLWAVLLSTSLGSGILKALGVIVYLFSSAVGSGACTILLPVVIEIVPRKCVIVFTVVTSIPFFLFVFLEDVFILFNLNVYLTVAIMVVTAVMGNIVLPEAKDKSLLQIEQAYSSVKYE